MLNCLVQRLGLTDTEQGGIANVLWSGVFCHPCATPGRARWKLTFPAVPFDFHGRYAIGCIFFLFNIVLFIFNTTMISLRFRLYPSTFVASLKHPTESLFVPASVISLGTILINISQYGTSTGKTGPWLKDVMFVMFWVYCGLAMMFTCGIYLIM